MEEDLLQLKFEGFPDRLHQNLLSAYETGDFSDVSILCDEQIYKGHKLVLSWFSGLFKKAVQTCSDSHLTILLCGVPKEILEKILDLIYKGKIYVPRDKLDEFLSAARILKLVDFSDIEKVENCEDIAESKEQKVETKTSVKRLFNGVPKKEKIINKSHQNNNQEVETSDDEKENKQEKHNIPKKMKKVSSESVSSTSCSEDEFEGWDPSSLGIAKVIPRSLFSHAMPVKIIPKEPNYKCTFCSEKRFTKEDIFCHFINQHPRFAKTHTCDKCEEIFRSVKDLQNHIKGHTVSVGFFCQECSFNTINFEVFESHKMVCSPAKKTVSCDDMEKSVKTEITYCSNDNETLDDVLGAISADFSVDRLVSDDDQYNEPLRTRQPCDDQNHKMLIECEFCFKVFVEEKKCELLQHEKSHAKSMKPYSCPFCRFESKDKCSRDDHLKKHNQFACNECPFKAANATMLETHIMENH